MILWVCLDGDSYFLSKQEICSSGNLGEFWDLSLIAGVAITQGLRDCYPCAMRSHALIVTQYITKREHLEFRLQRQVSISVQVQNKKPILSDFSSFSKQILVSSKAAKISDISTFFLRCQVPDNFLPLRAFLKLFNLELCSLLSHPLSLPFSFCSCLSHSLEMKLIWKGYAEEPLLKVLSTHFQPHFKDWLGFKQPSEFFCSELQSVK